jgi:hypothetical protein
VRHSLYPIEYSEVRKTLTIMSPRAAEMLSSVFAPGRQPGASTFAGSLIPMKTPGTEPEAVAFAMPAARRRTMIWDMHPSVHCSIIGTCLSCGELRRLLAKLGVAGADSSSDHELHKQGVALAGRPQGGAKFIQKALDRRHESVIRQTTKIKDEAGLRGFWDDALKRGDIPGAYWAVLSHPTATDAIMRRAFGDVHMLSHMIGAANRADIRRLRQLEEENAALTGKLEAQQRQLRDGFIERDGRIRLLNEALSRALAQAPASAEHAGEDAVAARHALADCERRLGREVTRRGKLEQRVAALGQAVGEAERKRRDAERECESLRQELALIETQIEARDEAQTDPQADAAGPVALDGMLVLYVGGRANQIPALRAIVERAGGSFLHHDGGIEHSMALLPGLIGRAGCAVVPIDCVSHDAMGVVKRQCRQAGKPFVPLRTSSVAGLLAGLAKLRAPDGLGVGFDHRGGEALAAGDGVARLVSA